MPVSSGGAPNPWVHNAHFGPPQDVARYYRELAPISLPAKKFKTSGKFQNLPPTQTQDGMPRDEQFFFKIGEEAGGLSGYCTLLAARTEKGWSKHWSKRLEKRHGNQIRHSPRSLQGCLETMGFPRDNLQDLLGMRLPPDRIVYAFSVSAFPLPGRAIRKRSNRSCRSPHSSRRPCKGTEAGLPYGRLHIARFLPHPALQAAYPTDPGPGMCASPFPVCFGKHNQPVRGHDLCQSMAEHGGHDTRNSRSAFLLDWEMRPRLRFRVHPRQIQG